MPVVSLEEALNALKVEIKKIKLSKKKQESFLLEAQKKEKDWNRWVEVGHLGIKGALALCFISIVVKLMIESEISSGRSHSSRSWRSEEK